MIYEMSEYAYCIRFLINEKKKTMTFGGNDSLMFIIDSHTVSLTIC